MSGRRRTLRGLQTAELLGEPPAHMKAWIEGGNKPASGSYEWAGLKYEKQFADYMISRYGACVVHGPWIKYVDDHGPGYCQPDVVYVHKGGVILFECKLTFRPRAASSKLLRMYGPCAAHIWPGPIHLVQVCRNLKPSAKKTPIIKSVKEILDCPTSEVMTWNWRPR